MCASPFLLSTKPRIWLAYDRKSGMPACHTQNLGDQGVRP